MRTQERKDGMAEKHSGGACTAKKTSIGGQALIEGIMMRGPEVTTMAVRHISGEIVLEKWPTSGQNRAKALRLPLIRGIVNFIDSLRFGYKCLMRSAELSGLEDEEPKESGKTPEPPPAATAEEETVQETLALEAEEAAVLDEGGLPQAEEENAAHMPEEAAVTAAVLEREGPVQPEPASPEKAAPKKGEQLLMSFLMVLSSLLGVALAVFLFLWLPSFLSSLMRTHIPAIAGMEDGAYSVLRGVFEGVFRIVLFVGYMLLVSLMKDIRRVFMYHGAEHKAIFCYEAGEELTVENVRRQRRFHPRCGTSFMILMLLIGVIVSMFIQVDSPLLRTGIKLLTIPLVVGCGYELIKLAGRKTNWFTRAISAPGMWLQHITTKEPDDGMIECAIAALKEVIPEDPEADNW